MLTVALEEVSRDIFVIMIDDEPWKRISASIFGRRCSFSHAASQEAFEELFFQLEFQQAKSYALKQLARQSYLSMELAKRLREKLVSPETVERVIHELHHYFDDEDKIWRYIQQQQEKGRGPDAIKQALLQKGVAESHFSELLSSEDFEEAIQRLLRSKYKTRNLADHKERQKVIASLCRRGFPLEAVFKALKVS